MTTPILSPAYDPNSFPFLAPRDTASRMRHFSQDVYNITPHSHLFNYVDALCGDAGAGSLKKELLFANFNQNLDSIFFRDLDDIFGKIAGLTRYASETYTYDPSMQQLLTDQWAEVMVKDNAYRQRIKDFMLAIGMGGTYQGFRMMCRAALSVDCELYEVSHYIDSGIYTNVSTLGRTGGNLRNEVVMRPLVSSITPSQQYLLSKLIDRIRPQDTVVTINLNGLAIHTPIPVVNVSASSTYFQVQRNVTGTRDVAKLPPTPVLAQDLGVDPSYLWVKPNQKCEAPYAAFQITQESTQYYTYSNTNTTAIDTIQYCEDTDDGRTLKTVPFTEYNTNQDTGFGPWIVWELADSPDNFPGGKNGQSPHFPPAMTTTGDQYNFPYASQADYVAKQTVVVKGLGGQVNDFQYRLPVTKDDNTSRRVWNPALSVPISAPTQQSTVTSQWFTRS